jgi:hypothetical protein
MMTVSLMSAPDMANIRGQLSWVRFTYGFWGLFVAIIYCSLIVAIYPADQRISLLLLADVGLEFVLSFLEQEKTVIGWILCSVSLMIHGLSQDEPDAIPFAVLGFTLPLLILLRFASRTWPKIGVKHIYSIIFRLLSLFLVLWFHLEHSLKMCRQHWQVFVPALLLVIVAALAMRAFLNGGLKK